MDIATILTWFKRGCKPTEAQFAATFRSFRHKDDLIPMNEVNGLSYALSQKSETGHQHTLADIIDYEGGDKEVINAMVAADSTELEAFTKSDGMHYILLSDQVLYRCAYDEGNDEYNLTEVDPDGNVIYSAYDANENLHIYLYNVPNLEFQDVTEGRSGKTLYTNDLASLVTRQLEKGIYSVVHVNSDLQGNAFGDAYTLTVGDSSASVPSRVLESRGGWAQSVLDNGSYVWQWHNYSYNGHSHQQSDINGLSDALAGKAASDHTHSQYLTAHQDISGKQDKTDNTLQTTVKTIVGAINELLGKFSDYSLTSHTHSQYLTAHQDISGKADKVSNPTSGNFAALDANGNPTDSGTKAADFAAAGHNHDSAYAAKSHSHSEYLTQHQDISGKQDVIADLATIRANAQMAATRAYTLDFGTAAELIQDVNMLGAITIDEIHTLNVAHLYVTYGSVSHQEINLAQPVSLNVANHAIITWEIERTTDEGLAAVGVRCSINQSNA